MRRKLLRCCVKRMFSTSTNKQRFLKAEVAEHGHLLHARLPQFFFVDSAIALVKTFVFHVVLPHGANLAQRPLYILGTVLN